MRIAYLVTRSDAVGGASVHVRDMARAMLDCGHEAVVLVGGEGPVTEALRAAGIPYRPLRRLVRPIHPLWDALAVCEVRRVLGQLRPDLLSSHSSKAGWVGRVAGRSLGIPTLFTAHGWAFTEGVPSGRSLVAILAEKLAGPLADRIITVSENDRRLALRYRLAPPERIITVYNGMPDVPPALLADPAAEPPRVAMVARFDLPKDQALLIKALTGLREMPWTLDLIGDGPRLAGVRELAAGRGLAERVRFLGNRRDVAELLAQAQLFVLTTDWEGFPRSILEAMRAGLPVVASDVGGVREAVADGETGFLVPRGDAGTLRERLARLLADPVLRRRMGEAGRRRYEASFTFEHMFRKTLAVYEEVLRESGAFRDGL